MENEFLIKDGVLEKYNGGGGDVVVPEGVVNIGGWAFEGSAVKSVVLPAGVVSIGASAFEGSAVESVVLPDSVVSIGAGAFKDSAVESVVLPEGLTKLGEYAFKNCKNLKKAVLPESLTEIPKGCFYGCENLEKVETGFGLKSIGSLAFYGCCSLKFNIPERVMSVGYNAFSGCGKSQEWDCEIAYVGKWAVECDYELMEENGSDEIWVKNGTFGVADGAFVPDDERCGFNIKTVKLPEGLRVIENDAFGWLEIESINIPDSLVYMGNILGDGGNIETHVYANGAFTPVQGPTCVRKFGDIEYLGNWVLNGRNASGVVSLAAGITGIAGSAFGRSGISGISFPRSLKSIGPNAFYDCDNLKNVTIPASVTVIGAGAFCGEAVIDCEVSCKPDFWDDKWDKDYYGNCKNVVNWGGAPAGVPFALPVRVSDSAIKSSKPQPVQTPPVYKAPPATEPADPHILYSPLKFKISGTTLVKYIGKDKKVIIPYGVSVIESHAFDGAYSVYIKKVTVPDTVKEIKTSAFEKCINVKKIKVPARCTVCPSAEPNGKSGSKFFKYK